MFSDHALRISRQNRCAIRLWSNTVAKYSPTLFAIKRITHLCEVGSHDRADRRAPGEKEVNNKHLTEHVVKMNVLSMVIDQVEGVMLCCARFQSRASTNAGFKSAGCKTGNDLLGYKISAPMQTASAKVMSNASSCLGALELSEFNFIVLPNTTTLPLCMFQARVFQAHQPERC